MSKEIQIVNANAADATAVVTIFNDSRAGMKYLPVVHTPEEVAAFFTSLVVDGKIMLIKEDGVIAGFMQIEDGELHHLYIAPNFQGKGFGKLLLDKAKEMSPTGIQLMVFEDNKGAIQFYEREGFTLVEKRNLEQTTNEESLPDRKYEWKIKS